MAPLFPVQIRAFTPKIMTKEEFGKELKNKHLEEIIKENKIDCYVNGLYTIDPFSLNHKPNYYVILDNNIYDVRKCANGYRITPITDFRSETEIIDRMIRNSISRIIEHTEYIMVYGKTPYYYDDTGLLYQNLFALQLTKDVLQSKI